MKPVGTLREVVVVVEIFALVVVITRGCCGCIFVLVFLFPVVGILVTPIAAIRLILLVIARHIGAGVMRAECLWEFRGGADVENLKALGAEADIAKPDLRSQGDDVGDMLCRQTRVVARGRVAGNEGDVEGSKLEHVGEALEKTVLEIVSACSLGIQFSRLSSPS